MAPEEEDEPIGREVDADTAEMPGGAQVTQSAGGNVRTIVQFGDGEEVDMNDEEAVKAAAAEFLAKGGVLDGTSQEGAERTTNERVVGFIEEIEHHEAEKAAAAEGAKAVYAFAKAEGFDVKALRQVVAIRKRAREEVQEERMILDLYLAAVGIQL